MEAKYIFLLISVCVQVDALCKKRCRINNPATCGPGYQCLPSNTTGKPDCYAKDEWVSWNVWGDCTFTCEGFMRTRTRSCNNPPSSNCPGNDTETELCTEPQFPSASDYIISTNKTTWEEAKALCENQNTRLVIIDDETEQRFLECQIESMDHWIGIQCASSTNCSWIDGTPVDGYTNWYPGEPRGFGCVYVGYGGNKWDDYYCNSALYHICEKFDLVIPLP